LYGEDTKTVKVRIAVAVDYNGHWVSAGWESASDEDLMTCAIEDTLPVQNRYFLTVELEVPEELKPKEVETMVTVEEV
jgi:hypothetical protein